MFRVLFEHIVLYFRNYENYMQVFYDVGLEGLSP